MDVIIFGSDGYNSLGALRSLGNKEDINVFLLLVSQKRINYILFSKFLGEYKVVDSEQEGIDYLLKNKRKAKTVILPTTDLAEALLDMNFDKLEKNYIFPNAKSQGRVNVLMDKEVMGNFALNAGLNVPKTIRCNRNDIPYSDIVYPCIIKPSKSVSGSKKDMAICYDKEALEIAMLNSSKTEEFLIQQYIDKEYDILLIGARLLNKDEVLIPGIFKKERWYLPGEDGSMGILSTNIKKYISLDNIKKFVRDIGYYGPFSIEFGILDKVPYFYEINLRNDGTSYYFDKLGINIPYIWSLDLYEEEITHLYNFSEKDYYFIDEFGDYLNIITSNLTAKKWFFDLRKASVFKYFSKGDIKPFLLIVPRMLLLSLYKVINLAWSKVKRVNIR